MLEASWSTTTKVLSVDIEAIVRSFQSKPSLLSDYVNEYLYLGQIDPKPIQVAANPFISLAGDKDVNQYTREDVKLFVCHLEMRGNKTATIRRRINSLSAIINYAFVRT